MFTRGLTRPLLYMALTASAFITLLLAGCQVVRIAAREVSVPPTPVAQGMTQSPTDKPAVMVTQTPTPAATLPPTAASSAPGAITLDLTGVAQAQTLETVTAVDASAGGPFWEVAPQYRRVTLQGYPVSNHLMKPQVFVYPVAELAGFNPASGKMAADLQAQLQSGAAPSGQYLPFLPLFNAAQVMHTQVAYLSFKNGKGVRFLTQFDQAPLPINNFELIYTFQGLTSDGKYYVAAVLPVTHPDLPTTQQVSTQQAAELSDFPAYLAKTVAALAGQPPASFTPDLTQLDKLVESLEVR
ncbi:MAG TPA: hypothetical protein VF806_07650 [Anaerolineaceae bacterium]